MKAIKARISLTWSDPLIYRDVLLAEDMSLLNLHTLIQVVMGWEDYHLHNFIDKRPQILRSRGR